MKLLEFSENVKLISDCQSGFRKELSTAVATTLLYDYICREMDNQKLLGEVYLEHHT